MRRVALAGAVVLLSGCSPGADDEPRPAPRAAEEIAQLVAELERSSARHDWRTLCHELLSSGARRRSGGRDCPRLVSSSGEGVRRPQIELLGIELRGARARARLRTRASGQAPTRDSLDLVRERGEWRIEALAG
jgi:hypothetical protein